MSVMEHNGAKLSRRLVYVRGHQYVGIEGIPEVSGIQRAIDGNQLLAFGLIVTDIRGHAHWVWPRITLCKCEAAIPRTDLLACDSLVTSSPCQMGLRRPPGASVRVLRTSSSHRVKNITLKPCQYLPLSTSAEPVSAVFPASRVAMLLQIISATYPSNANNSKNCWLTQIIVHHSFSLAFLY